MTQHRSTKAAARDLQERTGMTYQQCLQTVSGARAALTYVDAQELIELLSHAGNSNADTNPAEPVQELTNTELPVPIHTAQQLFNCFGLDYADLRFDTTKRAILHRDGKRQYWTTPIAGHAEDQVQLLVTAELDKSQLPEGIWQHSVQSVCEAIGDYDVQRSSLLMPSLERCASHPNLPPTRLWSTDLAVTSLDEDNSLEFEDQNDWSWECYDLNAPGIDNGDEHYGADQLTLPSDLMARYRYLLVELDLTEEIDLVFAYKGWDGKHRRWWYGVDFPAEPLTLWLTVKQDSA